MGTRETVSYFLKHHQKFNHFAPKTPNHPHWGKGMIQGIR